jgi:hypothetical protein
VSFLRGLLERLRPTPVFERADFVSQLAVALADVKHEDGLWGFLVLEVERTPYYVQFTSYPGPGIRAEAAGDDNLPPKARLDEATRARLRSLGWQPPSGTHEGDTAGNWFLEFGPAGAEDLSHVADLAMRTLEDGYGAAEAGPFGFHLDYWSDADIAAGIASGQPRDVSA